MYPENEPDSIGLSRKRWCSSRCANKHIKETDVRYRNYIPLLTLLLVFGFMVLPVGMARADEYPDAPAVIQQGTADGAYEFPTRETSLSPRHVSDAMVSLNVTNGDFVQVLMILTQQAGVNFILDAYWNTTPSGHIREGYRPPGGPDANGGGSGFGGGGGFNPSDGGGGGTVTMTVSEMPFDQVFGYLMQAYNLDYLVMRNSPDAEPILYIGTRERLETELGLGQITTYQLHYIDTDSAIDFLQTMDLLPSTSGFGIWRYDGGGNGGNSGGGGGNSGGGSGGFGGGGGGGGIGYGADPWDNYWFDPTQFTITGIDPDDLDGRSII